MHRHRRQFIIASVAMAFLAACADTNSPKELDTLTELEGPPAAIIYVDGGRDGEPPPPPIDTLSRADGAMTESASLSDGSAQAAALSSASISFSILHRATFTSDLEGTMGWMSWGKAEQPKGTTLEGYAEVYYRQNYLAGKGAVKITDARGTLYIDFGKHLDVRNGSVSTSCRAEKGGACATLYYRGATYVPRDGRPGFASGRLLVGVAQ